MSNTGSRGRGDLLVAFFVLTFAITWGVALLLVLFPGPITALFGELSISHPLFVLAVAGPTISATVLTVARSGWSGLRALYARLIQWRFGLQWYALLLLGLPLIAFLVSRVTGPEYSQDLSTPARLIGLLVTLLITGPLGEELGWRGFALPRLLQRFNPFVASLILGAIWGIWHVPAFFLSGAPQSSLSLPVFLIGALCLSFLATWLYLHTDGSVFCLALFHFLVNLLQAVFGLSLVALTVSIAVGAVLVVMLDRQLGWFRHDQTRQVIQGSIAPAPGR